MQIDFCRSPVIKQMSVMFSASTIWLILIGAALMLPARAALALDIYTNDFQTGVGPEWSYSLISATPLPADGSRKFLGRFDDHNVTLSLTGLSAHTMVSIDFDFYANGTWDGGEASIYGPDVWDASVVGGPTLLHTTFSNVTAPPFGFPFVQNYPDAYTDPYSGPWHPQFTGSAEQRTLGYIFSGYDVSAVYHLSFSLPHSASSIDFAFTAVMGQGYGGPHDIEEESWGLDNVRVSSDATVDAAGSPPLAFALEGVKPNPAVQSDLTVQFELPTAAPARLELIDIAGRRVTAREVGSLGAGRHAMNLAEGGRLAPGLYLVRLSQGAHARVTRVAVLD